MLTRKHGVVAAKQVNGDAAIQALAGDQPGGDAEQEACRAWQPDAQEGLLKVLASVAHSGCCLLLLL